VLENLQESTAIIEMVDSHGRGYLGTGFVISEDKDNYYLMTAKHVVSEEDTIAKVVMVKPIHHSKEGGAFVDAMGVDASVIAFSDPLDIAVVSVSKKLIKFPKNHFKFSNDKLPPLGAKVISIGHPKGDPGVIGTGTIASYYIEDGLILVQTTSLGIHGVSGGPLMNEKMEVIGVTQMAVGDNLNMSITSFNIKKWLKTVKQVVLEVPPKA
jgi:S1-C subfamily serine protease